MLSLRRPDCNVRRDLRRGDFAVCLGAITLALGGLSTGVAGKAAESRPAVSREIAANDILVNPESDTYDSRPALATAPDGTVWMAWHGYRFSRDSILARRLGPVEPGPVHTVSRGGNVHGPPVVVPGRHGSVRMFWSALQNGRWQIVGRAMEDGCWQPVAALSDPASDAVLSAAVPLGDRRIVLTWSALHNGRFRVWTRVLDGGDWRPPVPLSGDQHDAFRSAAAVDAAGSVWVFWDTYRKGNYAVMARPVLPQLGPPEQISPEGANCLVPVALAGNAGLCVAWLEVDDVLGGEGAISQWHTLHAAVRTPAGWKRVLDGQSNPVGATLTHGLIARMEPSPVATGGYLGRRRHPMLLAVSDAVWLLWERKGDHRGRTPDVTGELIGRPFRNARWGDPVVLHRGLVDYHPASKAPLDAGGTDSSRFLFTASELPRDFRRKYHLITGDVNVSSEFKQDDWTGWRPVDLPHPEGKSPRHEIRHAGKVYRLYWADLHCHSGLTADAEGEPDELLHYARDRAELDVVAMTENDSIYDCLLTEGEYALGHFLAGAMTREGRFVVLPGFEWTSRLPRSPEISPSDPRNWDSSRWGESYPNHRTVIYPPRGGPVLRHPEIGNDIGRLNDAALASGGLTFTQHATWDLSGHPVEAGVEVASGWGIYIQNPQRIHRALSDGHRVALIAGGDSHRRNPGLCGGLTGVYAEALTADAVLDALRNRRVFATNGSRIVLDSRANGSLMGSQTRAADGSVEIALNAIGTRPLVSATLIRDAVEVKEFEAGGNREFSALYRDENLAKGTHWYYWRVVQEGTSPKYPGNVKVARGQLAWSSPHWVVVDRRRAADAPVSSDRAAPAPPGPPTGEEL